MNTNTLPMTELHHVEDGGAYEVRDGLIVRTEEPTAPATVAAAGEQRADGEAGAVVGATSGEPPSSPEATATRRSGPTTPKHRSN